jgi:CubicO group peptidase (beta-lactamase class C family)
MLTDSSGWLIFWWAATNVDRMAALANQLDRLIDQLFTRPDDEGISLAFVVQQRGEVIAERYGVQPENIFQPEIAVTAATTLTSWSMAKSITHAALGLLVADGLIDVAGPASVPEWQGTDKADITLVQLLEMRSGLRFVEDYVDDELSHCIEMLFGESGPSHAAYAAALPLDHPPGTFYNYSRRRHRQSRRRRRRPRRSPNRHRGVPARAPLCAGRDDLGNSEVRRCR